MGLEKIRSVSKQGPYQLQVELSDGAGQQLPVARYLFRLDGEEQKFALHLEDEASPPQMSTGSSGIPFSTADRDNDLSEDVSCAKLLSGTTSSFRALMDGGTQTSHLHRLFLLQAVGGSAAAATGTSTADFPEGLAGRAESRREKCFGRQRDKDTL